MSGTFSSLHGRALSHATENLEKVRTAMVNAFGDEELRASRTEGHHGNPITILEVTVEDDRTIDEFFGRIPDDDIQALVQSLERRIDDGCNLFIKLDKQEAFAGKIRLGSADDVISVRVKVRVYPAKREVAMEAALLYLRNLLEPVGGGA